MQCTGDSGCFHRGMRAAIVRRYPVLFFPCVQYFRVSVIHRALTMTTGSLTCVRSYAYVFTRGWVTPTRSRHNIFNRQKAFLCSGRDSNLWSWNPLDLEADALPIEPSRPHGTYGIHQRCTYGGYLRCTYIHIILGRSVHLQQEGRRLRHGTRRVGNGFLVIVTAVDDAQKQCIP